MVFVDEVDEESFGGVGATRDARSFDESLSAGLENGGEPLNVADLCESLKGVGPEEAEWEVREALRKSKGEASVADVLGILLSVFQESRKATTKGNDSWDNVIAHCDNLLRLCDKSFLALSGADNDGGQDLPASIVATIYAECGRTFALAGQLPNAMDKLQKSLNVFGIIPETSLTDSIRRSRAAAAASFARVTKRMEQSESIDNVLEAYMSALQEYADSPAGDDTEEFLVELCDVLGGFEADVLSNSLTNVVADVAEAKFGEGSDPHVRILAELAQACTAADRLDLAGRVLVSRARILRDRCGPEALAFRIVEAETAEEDAVASLEGALPSRLAAGDIESALWCWEEALRLRETLEGSDSPVLVEMRKSLAALQQVAGATASGVEADGGDRRGDSDSESRGPEQGSGKAEKLRGWDEEEEEEQKTDWNEETSDVAHAASSDQRGFRTPTSQTAGAASPQQMVKDAWDS
eukprot:TRINITY_DN2212_c1_g1_i1.p1 TRINITY_DN2212_c1_g1~~TRINITY_DN2212_c1_g1_i1.p1  ORF type:complete len:469 (-),score=95.01 TRINITY_DN2212_c1_g1_i1:93-1499(-)